jgi:hypothetical protein
LLNEGDLLAIKHPIVDRAQDLIWIDFLKPVLAVGPSQSPVKSTSYDDHRVSSGRNETPIGYKIHRGEQNWMIDPEQLCDRRGDRHSRVDWHFIFSSNDHG